MCGRFEISLSADKNIASLLEKARSKGFVVKEGEIFPTDFVATLLAANSDNAAIVSGMKWGFTRSNSKGKVLINARQETVLELPTFQNHFPVTRCVIPATGFYEWDQSNDRKKTLFRLPGKTALYLAGFYRQLADTHEFIILTTGASRSFAKVHDREPVIIAEEQIRRYLHDAEYAKNLIRSEMPVLIGEVVKTDGNEIDLFEI